MISPLFLRSFRLAVSSILFFIAIETVFSSRVLGQEKDTTQTIPDNFRNTVKRSDVIVVVRIIGRTTPLTFLPQKLDSTSDTADHFKQVYNTAIHMVVVETLKGSYRTGDTIAYLQFSGNTSDSGRLSTTADMIPNLSDSSDRYLVYLNPYQPPRDKSGSDNVSLVGPTEIHFPVFLPSGTAYLLEDDLLKPLGCVIDRTPYFPGSLSKSRQIITKLLK